MKFPTLLFFVPVSFGFQPIATKAGNSRIKLSVHDAKDDQRMLQPLDHAALVSASSIIAVSTLLPEPALAASTAGSIPSALVAWAHFVGILGVAGGLTAERVLLQKNMSQEQEIMINNADGVYGLSAFSLLISGYFRVTQYAKGWEFYQNEPIFWVKMASVAVLGGLSFFPAIILFRRDQARRQGQTLAPLSDAVVDRLSTIINAELLAVLTIPLMATLMARGVGYLDEFFWPLGVGFYVLALGGSGFKYGKEAFEIMEAEGSLESASEE